jgi:hypothetical protein
MNQTLRLRIVEALEETSKLHPDMRFGQLVTNIAYWARGATETALWDVEDEEFLQAALSHLAEQKHTTPRKSKRAS